MTPSEFRLVEFVDDGEVMRAFRNGSIEAALITMDEVLAVAQSGMDPVILFVSDESRGGDAVVAHADVTSLADLKGRRVAVQINSVERLPARRALQAGGARRQRCADRQSAPDRHLAAFLRREVDAVVTYEPVRSQIVGAGRGRDLQQRLAAVRARRVDDRQRRLSRAARYALAAAVLGVAARRGRLRTSAGARDWVAARMKVTPDALAGCWTSCESSILRERRAPGSAAAASAGDDRADPDRLLESGLLTQRTPLEPIFRWPAGVDQAACRG